MRYCAFCKNQAEKSVQFVCERCDAHTHPLIDVCFWCLTLLQESSHRAYREQNHEPPQRPLEHTAVLEGVNAILEAGRRS